jgi:hypothetical protein
LLIRGAPSSEQRLLVCNRLEDVEARVEQRVTIRGDGYERLGLG